jgi:glycosyltransferase involved in cell wall biosynthesis
LRQALRRHKPDYLYVPSADGLTQVMVASEMGGGRIIPRGVKSEGLLMRGGFAYPYAGLRYALQTRISFDLLRRAPWDIIHHLDPLPYQILMQAGGRMARRSRLMPEPVDPMPKMDQATARRMLRLPTEGRFLGLLGYMDERKGADRLIRGFAAAKLRPDDRLLLAGKLSPTIARLLQTEFAELVRSGRIWAPDQYLSNEELDASAIAMDLMCTLYPRHIGSVSMVIRGSAAGRPVLSSDFGWLGYVVPRFKLGRTCNVHNREEVAAAIADCLDSAPGFRLTEGGKRFVEFHTGPNFQRAYVAGLREHLGLPPLEDLRTWDWVLDADAYAQAT